MSLLAGGTVGVGMDPAKFTFDVTAAPSCTNDYVAFNTSLVASPTSPSIVAFDNLYTTQGSVGGFCSADGPSVKWAYRVTTAGNPVTSVVLSGDGTQVAFVESRTNVNGGSILHILKWKPGAGLTVQGTVAAPALPDTTMLAGQAWNTTNCPAANSCIVNVTFSGARPDTNSAPFYDYAHDVIYVGDDNGSVHKFTGVFLGTPTEDGAPWPISVEAGSILTGPIYDSVSGNIFVGGSFGLLRYIMESNSVVGGCENLGVPPCVGGPNQRIGGGNSVITDAPVVDGSTQQVIVVATDDSFNGTVEQVDTALSTPVRFKIGGSTGGTLPIYSGAFDNTYFTSAKPTISGHMYVCGRLPPTLIDRPYINFRSTATAS